MKVSLKKGTATGLSTLVVFAAKDKNGKASAGKLSPGLQNLFSVAQQDAAFAGSAKESCFFRGQNVDGYTNVLFVGLGPQPNAESIRVGAAIAYNSLKGHKVVTAAVHGDSLVKQIKDPALAIQALVEGLNLTEYEYNDLKSKPKDDAKKPKLGEISVLLSAAPSAAMNKALQRAEILAECQNFARWLGDSPGNYMTPTILANETVKAAKGTGLKVTVWDYDRIKKERFGGLLAVNQGSDEEPRFIMMEYNGAGKSAKPVVFVGKGLTFDTGGISIKPSASMEEMKYDMCGGAAVIGAMLALAKLKAKVNVVGLVPSTDNMPGPTSFKPGDVYIARNGKSVEVYNTDAEGRLILGDALAYAAEMKPAAIFDAATLTGAILIALGNTHSGVFTRDPKVMRKIQDAAETSGELVWPMPLTDFHVEDMKGTHADLCNISGGRLAGSATAAAFLEEMVGRDVPWAHFDIAGTAWSVNGRFPYHPKKSASGIIVRTFVEMAENF
jgi:leucyl aminopeptidase